MNKATFMLANGKELTTLMTDEEVEQTTNAFMVPVRTVMQFRSSTILLDYKQVVAIEFVPVAES